MAPLRSWIHRPDRRFGDYMKIFVQGGLVIATLQCMVVRPRPFCPQFGLQPHISTGCVYSPITLERWFRFDRNHMASYRLA